MARRSESDVARLYHLHSCHERACLIEPAIDMQKPPGRFRTYPGSARVALPGRDFTIAMPLGEAIEKRRSVREVAPRPLPLEMLGRLLHTSYGVREHVKVAGEWAAQRPTPSAGGRYPLELYVATQSVEGLDDGIYHYDAHAHELELRRAGPAQPAIADLTLGQEVARVANVVVVVTAVRERTMWKYGQRGYRYVWLDAGHVGQNVYLVATALGLGPTAIGGFFDGEMNALLDLPSDEEAVYVLCVGQPAEAAGEGG